jgi:hypothetical protein
VEALIALTISTAIVLLAGSLFVVQGNFYDSLGRRAEAQDNVRAVAERMATEIRSVMPGGVEQAAPDRLVVRRPLAIGAVCDRNSGRTFAHLGMGDEIVGDAVQGYAWRDSTAVWHYRTRNWTALFDAAGGVAAAECFAAGADTLGRADAFFSLRAVSGPSDGDLLMIFAELEYEVDTSALDPSSLGLFRTVSGNPRIEFASRLGPETRFGYRVGSTWRSSVAGTDLDDIAAVRVTVESRIPAETGGMSDAVASWTVDIPLRNGT